MKDLFVFKNGKPVGSYHWTKEGWICELWYLDSPFVSKPCETKRKAYRDVWESLNKWCGKWVYPELEMPHDLENCVTNMLR
jgi:hypothetical protein